MNFKNLIRSSFLFLNNYIFNFKFLVVFLFIFSFFYVFQVNAYCISGLPTGCGSGPDPNASTRELTGVCTFTPAGQQIYSTCESCSYSYAIASLNCYDDVTGVFTGTQSAPGAVCAKTLQENTCSSAPVSGCSTNADCPHPPSIVCDTFCDLSAGSPGSCQPVDPTCSTTSGVGPYCGDSYCSSGENNANCSSDCPPVVVPGIQIIVDPSSRTITRGGSTSYFLTVRMLGGFYNKVTLSAVCPAGANCTITPTLTSYDSDGDPEPNVVDPTTFGHDTATLTVNNTSGLGVGNYSITVTGVGYAAGPTATVYPVLRVITGVPAFLNTITGICPSRTITLTWGTGQDANAYRLYRHTTNAQPATPFAVVGNVTSFVDNPPTGATYYYWVDSLHNPSGNFSATRASAPVALSACPPIVDIKGWGDSVPQSAPVDGPINVNPMTSGGLIWTSNASSCEIFRGATSLGTTWPANGSAPLGGVSSSDTHSIVCTGSTGLTSNTDSFTRNILKPTIVLSPTNLTFNGIFGGTAPAGQTLNIANTGSSSLNWTFSRNGAATWCNLSAVSGTVPAGTSQNVTVTVSAPNIVGVGPHSDCGIRISDSNATNNPQDAGINYNVAPAPVVDIKGWGDSVPQSAPVDGPINVVANSTGGLVWTSTNATNCEIFRGATSLGTTWPANGSAPLGGVTASDTHSIVCFGGGSTSNNDSFTRNIVVNPYQAICDSTWREIPGGGSTPSQPVGIYLPNTPNIQNNWANAVVVRGWGNNIHYQSCNYSLGNPCVWNSSYDFLNGITNYPPFTDTPAAWGVYHYGTDNNTYLKWNTNTGWVPPAPDITWTNLGVSPKSWGQPFRWTDVNNRTWQTKRNSDGTIHYYCTASGGGPVCEPLHYNPDPTRSSVSPSSVTAGGAFTTRCDYDSSGIDAITASVTGGGTCTWASYDKTTAVFNCTAGATVGTQTVTCSLNAGTGSNVCAQSNVVDTVDVTAAPQASFVLNPTTMSFSGVTGSPAPSQQILQITSTGSADVWHSEISNQSWCRVNGVNNAGPAVTGAVPSSPVGQYTPVAITVDSPSTVGVGTHTCIITVTDPASNPTSRTLTVTYTVTAPSGGPGPTTVSLDNSTCAQMTINWSAVSSATSYNVYRNTTGSAPVAGDLVQSGLTSLTWTNSVSAGIYYYWVSAVVGGVETAKVAPNSGANLNPTAVLACGSGNLNTSDKDIIGINGTAYSSNNCGGTDPLSGGVNLKLNDVVTFQINLCNDGGTGTSSNITIRDTLTNLVKPSTKSDFNAYYNGIKLTYDGAVAGSSCTPSGNNRYCAFGTVPNQTLVFNLTGTANNVPSGLRRALTFEAQLAIPTGYTQSTARFQNSFIIGYNRSAGVAATTPISSTPLILFNTGKGVPIIIEIP